MNEIKRLRLWAEQPQVVIPSYLFKYYKQLQITDDEAIILLHLCSYLAEGCEFPTPHDLTERTYFHPNDISVKLQRLMQKGAIEITQATDYSGRITEKYSVTPTYERIMMLIDSETVQQQAQQQQVSEAEIYKLLEQEFARLLSPIELETVGKWLDEDHHTPEIIKAAVKEAVLAGKVSFKYIDRILFEWKRKNITTLQQIEKQTDQYRQYTIKPQPVHAQAPVPNKLFYNWLEERE